MPLVQPLLEQLVEYQVRLEFVGECVNDETVHIKTHFRSSSCQRKNKNRDIEKCLAGDLAVGSVSENKMDFSIGYQEKSNPVWVCPGVIHGVVWMKIETKSTCQCHGQVPTFHGSHHCPCQCLGGNRHASIAAFAGSSHVCASTCGIVATIHKHFHGRQTPLG